MNFFGIQVNYDVFLKDRTDITFPHEATTFGAFVVGLHFTGNAKAEDLLSIMGASIKFPAIIDMPCGWSVTIPTLPLSSRDIAYP